MVDPTQAPQQVIPETHLRTPAGMSDLPTARERLDERLRFERLVADLSARFVNVPPAQVDTEIECSLRLLLDFFEVDRCGLLRGSPDKTTFQITHACLADGIPAVPLRVDLPTELFPWAYRQLIGRHEVVSVTTLDEMPAEAEVDKHTYSAWGIRSHLNIPIVVTGADDYIVSMNAVRSERAWPQEFIPRLRLLGEIFVNALERKRMRLEMESQLCFERLVSDLSAQFVKLAPGEVEPGIERGLQQVLEFFRGDRCGLLEVHPEARDVRVVHAWAADGIERVSGEVNLAALFPWTYAHVVEQGQDVIISRLEELPPEGEQDRQSYSAMGIRSSLAVPLFVGHNSRYVLVMQCLREERIWPGAHVSRLRLLGEIFVNALARRVADDALRESEARLSMAAISAEAGLWVVEGGTGSIWATEKARELHGFSPDEELWVERFLAVVHPDDRRRVDQTVQQAMQSGEDARAEYRVVLPDGSVRWISSRGRAQRAGGDESGRLMGVSADITARKQMEQQLEARLREIEDLKQRLEAENIQLRAEVTLQHGSQDVVGRSDAMKKVLAQAGQVARTDSTVLILGETGTGKEVVARAIHDMSGRRERPLITVNCASLPPTLIESELFGRERGAYTGALTRMVGRFELADGSTLFLDEIGELPLDIQSKLLRVLQEGELERLGSTKTLHVNVRVIAATNRHLAREVSEGRFRRDLYYRLNVFPILVPPLRERPEDIPILVWTFVEEFGKRIGKQIESIPKRGLDALQRYSWPGNVRELRNVIEHAMIVTTGKTLEVRVPTVPAENSVVPQNLEDLERRHILGVLQKTGWRVAGAGGAADVLGLNRTTLNSRMKRLGIKRPDA